MIEANTAAGPRKINFQYSKRLWFPKQLDVKWKLISSLKGVAKRATGKNNWTETQEVQKCQLSWEAAG